MSTAFTRAPHIQGAESPKHPSEAPNAALLVDFDNVTMGMRSDLSKELKTLLNSDIIKGKVTVQRAYADWRRYPQYIVPLSEASIDLIFAPAYGSNKKNATDIRMAIDGMELVFTRPEIGTYILLTGDSDFSSLVLKLKEYGKYVIGVGIQESSSDILVQNCDEYYSYTSISGLRKSTDEGPSPSDPWVLVEKAVGRMVKRRDVMRSDRLKQVMLEIDEGFDEKSLGFSKFSRFLTEAAQKGILQLRKLENGQYEIQPSEGRPARESAAPPRRSPAGRSTPRDGDRKKEKAAPAPRAQRDTGPAPPSPGGKAALEPAYELLCTAVRDLQEDQEGDEVRDSDVKRRMLALNASFDEAALGFSKFSRFLRQAHDHEVVTLRKGDGGHYHVSLGSQAEPGPGEAQAPAAKATPPATPSRKPRESPAKEPEPEMTDADSRRLRPRTAARRTGKDEPPPFFEGQVVGAPGKAGANEVGRTEPVEDRGPVASPAAQGPQGDVLGPEALRLPTDRKSIVKYLSNSYGGVGEKTAESLVDTLGPQELFRVLQTRPSRVEEILPPARAEKVLEGWNADFARRKERYLQERGGGDVRASEQTVPTPSGPPEEDEPASRRRRGRRTRRGGSAPR